MADMRGLLCDLEDNLKRVRPGAGMPERELELIASIVVATGAEVLSSPSAMTHSTAPGPPISSSAS